MIRGVSESAGSMSRMACWKCSLLTWASAPSSAKASTRTYSWGFSRLRDQSNQRFPASERVASVNERVSSGQRSAHSGLTGNLTTMKIMVVLPVADARRLWGVGWRCAVRPVSPAGTRPANGRYRWARTGPDDRHLPAVGWSGSPPAGATGRAERRPHMLNTLRSAVADPSRVSDRAIDLHATAHDASHFLLIPQAVVTAANAAEVGALMAASAAQGIPLTFRSGGTSLSGQAVSDSVLVDVRRNFRDIEVLDDGARVRVQPGTTVRALNARLARHGRRFGPDPASEAACTIGGVVANNSSGMNCGTTENAYRTLESMTLVLPSGTVIDTAGHDADARLRALEPELHDGLDRLARRVRGNAASVSTLRHQFSMKNTMGYGLNSLLDFEKPVDMLAHLVVGSEGTLGFVAEAVFRTVPKPTHTATGLLVFPSLAAANAALPGLVETGAATVELLDATSLRVGQALKGAPGVVTDLHVDEHAALLVEYSAGHADELAELRHRGAGLLDGLRLDRPAAFTTDAAARASLWHLRKGLYASVAGARPQGTTAL